MKCLDVKYLCKHPGEKREGDEAGRLSGDVNVKPMNSRTKKISVKKQAQFIKSGPHHYDADIDSIFLEQNKTLMCNF